MLNLQLITKISGKDMAFRNAIINTINQEAVNTSNLLKNAAQEQRWMLCCTLVNSYLLKIQPYANLTFSNQLKAQINRLRSSLNDLERRHLVSQIAGSISEITSNQKGDATDERNASRA